MSATPRRNQVRRRRYLNYCAALIPSPLWYYDMTLVRILYLRANSTERNKIQTEIENTFLLGKKLKGSKQKQGQVLLGDSEKKTISLTIVRSSQAAAIWKHE